MNSVSALLDSLSPSRPAVGRSVPLLDPAGEPVALRIDLRDYDLDASDWARLEAATEVGDRRLSARGRVAPSVEACPALARSARCPRENRARSG